MGAGIVECDVTFTKDGQLVCRHSECDLHTTTNILVTDLGKKCTEPFTPAQLDATGKLTKPASALCCTSDLTVYWVRNAPAFGRQAVYLDSIDPTVSPPIPRLTSDELRQARRQGVRIFAPPIFALLSATTSLLRTR